MPSYLRLSILLCALFLSCALVSASNRTKEELHFRSGGDLPPLVYITIFKGWLGTTAKADGESRISFASISLEQLANEVKILQVGLKNGTILAVRPRELRYSESTNEVIITKGTPWEYKDIVERPRSRWCFGRRACL